jgi:hypothetical protein
MTQDLSIYDKPVGSFVRLPETPDEWRQYRLSEEQVAFYREKGYVAGIRILDDDQVEILLEQLSLLTNPAHPGHGLFYEYHSNESPDPARVLFHALGAWRITPGFHDVLWHPAFTVPASQLLEGPVRFWHDQLFCKPAQHGGVAPGLFVLDAYAPHGSPDLLDRPGRCPPRQRLPAVRARQSPVEPAPRHGPGGRHGRHSIRAQRRAEARVQAGGH